MLIHHYETLQGNWNVILYFISGFILGKGSANERRRYIATSPLIGLIFSDQWTSDYRTVGLLTIRTNARFSDQWTFGPTTIRNIGPSPTGLWRYINDYDDDDIIISMDGFHENWGQKRYMTTEKWNRFHTLDNWLRLKTTY